MTANAQEVQAEPKKTDKEVNFEQLRKVLEQERQARIQAEEKAAQLEKVAKEKVVDTNDDDDSSDEPYVDEKRLNKKLSKFEKNIVQTIEKKAEEKARSMLDQERKTMYFKQNADFNDVMTQENLQKFADKHPQLAESILQIPDSFERQKLVYENMKALNVHKKEEPKPSIQDKIDQNRRSPYYQPSGIGNSPYSGAGDFSAAGQKNAYAKMQELKNKLRI